MRIHLPYTWQNRINDMPETGMGYHLVDVEYIDGSIDEKCMVYGALDIELPATAVGKTFKRITPHIS